MRSIKTVIPAVLRGLGNPETNKRGKLISEWPNIAGKRLALRTKPALSKKGILYVYVDEPALAFEMSQKHRASLLKRAQATVGEKEVCDIKIRVGNVK